MIRQFFAVTVSGSLYLVRANPPGIKKIAESRSGNIGLSKELECGPMIAICRQVQSFIPEGHSMLSPLTTVVRKIEGVNTMWWRGHTSNIVGLFKQESGARKCLRSKNQQFCDPRWAKETLAVLSAINENHPVFVVCRFDSLALPLALLSKSKAGS